MGEILLKNEAHMYRRADPRDGERETETETKTEREY